MTLLRGLAAWEAYSSNARHYLQEVALIGMLGYLSYLAGELAGLSGIVTLFCCAVAISHYALHNISAPARVTLVRSCQTLSYVSEGAIFIYVGMDTLDPLKWKVGAPASRLWPLCGTALQHAWSQPTAGSPEPGWFCCISSQAQLRLQSSGTVMLWIRDHPHVSAMHGLPSCGC